MTSVREQFKSDILRKRLEALFEEGVSVSKAAKLEGTSYAHAKTIHNQWLVKYAA